MTLPHEQFSEHVIVHLSIWFLHFIAHLQSLINTHVTHYSVSLSISFIFHKCIIAVGVSADLMLAYALNQFRNWS